MNLIDRYLGKTILFAIATVLLIVAGLQVFILLMAELRDIGHQHYTILSALFYVLLCLPDQLYQIFPMIGLLGMLMGFGLLASHRELVVLQAVGLSPLKITFSALKTIFLLLIVVSFIGEILAPQTSEFAIRYKEAHLNTVSQNNVLAYDLWLKIKNNYLHVHEMETPHVLHGVSWYHFDDQGSLLTAFVADRVVYHQGQWVADQLKQTDFSESAIHVETKAHAICPLMVTPSILLDSTKSVNNLSLHALHQSLQFRKDIHSENDALQLAFWRRVIQPIASLVMILLAIPFIFGPLRQASYSFRLVIGIAVGFAFYYLNQFFGPLVLLFHWPPLVGALLPTLVFGACGLFLLKVQRK